MAGIDRTDAIKRPTDSTLTPRTLDRGSEPVVRLPADSLDSIRPSLPAVAVVVEQTIMGTRDKPLYDLVLSLNQQWVRVQSERAFPPGTVLMVEATPENQLRVLPQVDSAQLNRMMQASLQFWQAHSLPRAHNTQMPAPPSFSALQTLAVDAPELQALVQWLSQKPALSPRAIAQWMQAFSPLARLQPPIASLSPTPLAPAQPPPSASAVGGQPRPLAGDLVYGVRVESLTPLLRAIATVNSGNLSLTGSPSGTTPPATSPGVTVMLVPLQAGAPVLPTGTVTVLPTSDRALSTPSAQSPMAAQQQAPVGPGQIASLRVAVVETVMSPTTLQSAVSTLNAGTAGIVSQATPGPASSTGQNAATASPGQPVAPAAGLNPTATPTDPLLLPTRFSTLAAPTSAPDQPRADQRPTVPLEVRLSQWLAVLDSRIQQHPASLQQALAQQAQRMLNTPPPGYAPGVTVQNQGASASIKQEDLQPLLQLRTLLESLQGKTQNNAIQQALGSLANPDAPPVQQLSIPLLWLGPNHWLNMEWWQEKTPGGEAEAVAPGKRAFRFRLFFELAPLAPLCADLHWTPEHTDVVFWSKDKGTLSIINSHLDTLEQWTQGLGERALQTRHGMPPKKTTPEPDQFKPLVDIRT